MDQMTANKNTYIGERWAHNATVLDGGIHCAIHSPQDGFSVGRSKCGGEDTPVDPQLDPVPCNGNLLLDDALAHGVSIREGVTRATEGAYVAPGTEDSLRNGTV